MTTEFFDKFIEPTTCLNFHYDKYNIPVVEDGAEALGSKINKQIIGSTSYLCTLSFNGNKITKEYYVNDYGTQIENFVSSVYYLSLIHI